MAATGTDELKQRNYEIAQAIAPTWARRRADIERFAAPVRAWLVRELAPRPGEAVLELAAGNGDTGFEVASHIGGRGRLITSDFAPAMLESARHRAGELGVRNVEFRVIDAQQIDLDTNSVDGVVCRYAYMLMIDPQAAITETRRVLRPGGRLVLAVWGPPSTNPFFTAAVGPLVGADRLPAPQPDGPGVFRLADAPVLHDMLVRAGFDQVRIEQVPVCAMLRDVDAYLGLVADTAGPIGLAIQGLSPEERTELAAAVGNQLEPYLSGDGLGIPGLALCAVAA